MEGHWEDGHSRLEGRVRHKNSKWEKLEDIKALFPIPFATQVEIKFKEWSFWCYNCISLCADNLSGK